MEDGGFLSLKPILWRGGDSYQHPADLVANDAITRQTLALSGMNRGQDPPLNHGRSWSICPFQLGDIFRGERKRQRRYGIGEVVGF